MAEKDPLDIVAATMPRWPGRAEAIVVEGCGQPPRSVPILTDDHRPLSDWDRLVAEFRISAFIAIRGSSCGKG
jgi:hypothetical protein